MAKLKLPALHAAAVTRPTKRTQMRPILRRAGRLITKAAISTPWFYRRIAITEGILGCRGHVHWGLRRDADAAAGSDPKF